MTRGVALVAVLLVAIGNGSALAQVPPAAPSARAQAPVDLTGDWVSVVTEDWRWRMVTPPKGDYASVPLTAESISGYDCAVLATDHEAFDFALIQRYARLIVDTRGVYLEPAANVVKA